MKPNNSLLQSTKALMSNSEVKFEVTKTKKAKEVVRNFQQSLNYLAGDAQESSENNQAVKMLYHKI